MKNLETKGYKHTATQPERLCSVIPSVTAIIVLSIFIQNRRSSVERQVQKATKV